MRAVTDLNSALAAIATIVEQGEGGRRDHEKSHYAQFVTIGKQYDAMLAADSGFTPYRPVAPTPVMFRPIADDGATHVSVPESAAVLDLANACYALMLRLLASATGGMHEKPFRAVQLGCAIETMSIVKALAIRLTTMRAAAGAAQNASMNFHLARATLALPQRDAGMADGRARARTCRRRPPAWSARRQRRRARRAHRCRRHAACAAGVGPAAAQPLSRQ